MISRQLAQAARQFADQQTGRIADLPKDQFLILSVASTSPNLQMTWRGGTYAVTGGLVSYTPAAGDRVLCVVVDDQLIAVGKII